MPSRAYRKLAEFVRSRLAARAAGALWLTCLLSLGALSACGHPGGRAAQDEEAVESRERGRIALTRYQCGACHVIPGVPGRGRFGPSLEAFGLRAYIAGYLPNERGTLERWIQGPSALVVGTLMPDMGVPPKVAADMAAYLLAQR